MPKKKADPLPDEIKQLAATDAASLMARVKTSNLGEADRDFLIRLIGFVITVRALLEKRNFSLKAMLRRMFGLKSERDPKNGPKPRNGGGGGGGTPKPGHGRNGRDKYPGARRVECKHETLKVGDQCPECHAKKLDEADPGVAYRWTGQAPLILTIFMLQRLICHSCKSTFTATVPGETAPAAPASADAPSNTAPPERETDATANAMVSLLRYDYGVPHNRLAQLQESQGVPLPASNQWKMNLKVFTPAQHVHVVFEELAAQGNLVQNDDTHMRVLTLERGREFDVKGGEAIQNGDLATAPPKINPEQKGRKGTMTGILSMVDGHTIALYYTGLRTAGKNLAEILIKRKDDLGPPIQMCDGLSANLPAKLKTILCKCLDHSRRKYFDVQSGFPDEVNFVLVTLRLIYQADDIAATQGMSPEQRLAYHQEHSGPAMDALLAWATAQLQTDLCRTSGLGKAIKYMIKHWKGLTTFLRVAGAPIANSAVERLLKRAIRHRKNSLQYLNLRGAHVGDVIMSLIQTCRLNGVDPFDYLTTIQRFKAHVEKAASEWLPWNYTATRSKLLGAMQPAGP